MDEIEPNDIALAFSEGKKEGMEEAGKRVFEAVMRWAGRCNNCGEPVDLVKVITEAFYPMREDYEDE